MSGHAAFDKKSHGVQAYATLRSTCHPLALPALRDAAVRPGLLLFIGGVELIERDSGHSNETDPSSDLRFRCWDWMSGTRAIQKRLAFPLTSVFAALQGASARLRNLAANSDQRPR